MDYDEVGGVGFVDQVLCTRYTKPGDSGSLVLDKESGKAVGLHFAGANGGSVFSPIDDVLEALGVTLVTKSIGTAGEPPNETEEVTERPPRAQESERGACVMATERDANLAREQHAEALRRLGAHAIAVDEVTRKGEKQFAVIAFFEAKPRRSRAPWKSRAARRRLEVPLVAASQAKFKPE